MVLPIVGQLQVGSRREGNPELDYVNRIATEHDRNETAHYATRSRAELISDFLACTNAIRLLSGSAPEAGTNARATYDRAVGAFGSVGGARSTLHQERAAIIEKLLSGTSEQRVTRAEDFGSDRAEIQRAIREIRGYFTTSSEEAGSYNRGQVNQLDRLLDTGVARTVVPTRVGPIATGQSDESRYIVMTPQDLETIRWLTLGRSVDVTFVEPSPNIELTSLFGGPDARIRDPNGSERSAEQWGLLAASARARVQIYSQRNDYQDGSTEAMRLGNELANRLAPLGQRLSRHPDNRPANPGEATPFELALADLRAGRIRSANQRLAPFLGQGSPLRAIEEAVPRISTFEWDGRSVGTFTFGGSLVFTTRGMEAFQRAWQGGERLDGPTVIAWGITALRSMIETSARYYERETSTGQVVPGSSRRVTGEGSSWNFGAFVNLGLMNDDLNLGFIRARFFPGSGANSLVEMQLSFGAAYSSATTSVNVPSQSGENRSVSSDVETVIPYAEVRFINHGQRGRNNMIRVSAYSLRGDFQVPLNAERNAIPLDGRIAYSIIGGLTVSGNWAQGRIGGPVRGAVSSHITPELGVITGEFLGGVDVRPVEGALNIGERVALRMGPGLRIQYAGTDSAGEPRISTDMYLSAGLGLRLGNGGAGETIRLEGRVGGANVGSSLSFDNPTTYGSLSVNVDLVNLFGGIARAIGGSTTTETPRPTTQPTQTAFNRATRAANSASELAQRIQRGEEIEVADLRRQSDQLRGALSTLAINQGGFGDARITRALTLLARASDPNATREEAQQAFVNAMIGLSQASRRG
jgi:hypothetical protein